MGNTPAGKLYQFTSKKTGEKIEFRSTVKPDKNFIKQKFDEMRANKSALEESKIQAARETSAAQKKAFFDPSHIVEDITSAGKGLAGVLGGPVYAGIESIRQLPDIPDMISQAEQEQNLPIGQKIQKKVQELPIVGDIGQTLAAGAYGISPKAEPVAEYLKTTPEKAAVGGGVLAGMAALGRALRTSKGAAPKTEVGLEPFEEVAPEVAPKTPQTIIADAQAHSVNLGIIKEQLKGVDKSLHNQVLSEMLGRDVKGLKNLTADEAVLIAENFKQVAPETPVESPTKGVVSIDDVSIDPNWENRTYTPERLRQMDMQEDVYLRSIPEPLITPPPVTDLAPRGLTDIPPRVLTTPPPETGIVPVGPRAITRIPDVEPLKAAHEQMTLENNLRRLFEKEQRSRELGDVEEPIARPFTDREAFIERYAERPKTIEAETFPVEEFKSPSSIRDAQGNLYTNFSAVTKESLLKVNDIYNRLGKVPSPSRLMKELGLNYAEALEVVERFKDTLRQPQRQVPTKLSDVTAKLPEVESPKIPPTSAKEGLPLSNKEIIESQGLKFEGEMDGLTYFTDPKTSSTLAMSPDSITPESLANHVQESRAKFGIKEGLQEPKEITESPPQNLTPEQQEFLAKGGKITKLPPVEPVEPVEFGKPLEEIRVKAEKHTTQGVSIEQMYDNGYKLSEIVKTLQIPYDKVESSLIKSGRIKPMEFLKESEVPEVPKMKATGRVTSGLLKLGYSLEDIKKMSASEALRNLQGGKKKSLLRKFHEEESGFLDLDRVKELLGKTETMINKLPPVAANTFREYQKWVNARAAGDIEGLNAGKRFRSYDQVSFDKYQSNPSSFPRIKKYFEDKYAQLREAGVDLNFKEAYLPQLWKEKASVVREISRRLGLRPSFTLESVYENYQAGKAAGLTPRFSTIGELIGWYERRANKAIADRQFFNHLVNQRLIKPMTEKGVPVDWQSLDPDHFPIKKLGNFTGVFKAPPELARLINNYLQNPEGPLQHLANFVTGLKNVVISSGIPRTGLNAHGFNITARAAMVGKGLEALNYLLNPAKAGESLEANLPKAPKFIREGLSLTTEEHAFNWLKDMNIEEFGKSQGLLGKGEWAIKNLKRVHNHLFEEPLFNRIIPALKLELVQDIHAQLMKKGLSDAEATARAARTTNDVFGGINWIEMGRSRAFQDLLRSTFLAADWLESNVNLAKKVPFSAISKTPESAIYFKIARRMLALYATVEVLNKVSSGHWAHENDKGHEFQIEIGMSENRKRYLKPFGTGADFARLPMEIAHAAIKGDLGQAARIFKNRLSIPVGASINLLTGKSYTGQEIYKGTRAEQTAKIAREASEIVAPQYGQAAIDVLSGQRNIEQGVAQAVEAPLTYAKPQKKKIKSRSFKKFPRKKAA